MNKLKKCNYLGNYKNWIDSSWIEYMKNNQGELTPKSNGIDVDDVYDNSQPPWIGCDPDHGLETRDFQVRCITYRKNNFGGGPRNLPFDLDCDGWDWFFVKIPPGKGQPVHRDKLAIPNIPNNVKDIIFYRFWVPLEDYRRGHIFFYEDQIITGYKAGDIFQYANVDDWHSGANMGHSTRYTCNIDAWKFIF